MNWTQQFDTFCFLDNHGYQIAPHTQECLLAAGVRRQFTLGGQPGLENFQAFIDTGKTWLFGHLGYGLQTGDTPRHPAHPDRVGFPDLFFFEPAVLIRLNDTALVIEADDPDKVHSDLIGVGLPGSPPGRAGAAVPIYSRLQRDEYIAIVNRLKEHIRRGDCYEINFCQEFFSDHAVIDPLEVYRQLSAVSPNPFSAFYRLGQRWLLCASPERFLQRQGDRIVSQPIKGTAKRIAGSTIEDEQEKTALFISSKDRSENVMVVDLVRNDLARICREGSVKVDELYGIYSFPQVHQMISTVSGTLRDDVSFADIIRATFPMGSMTGAPKKRVMELIAQYEHTKRGLFSGAIGYISPEGDFDFNVVIRSILYNAAAGYLSFLAGSGLTFYSEAESEWEECMVKAEAIRNVLSGL